MGSNIDIKGLHMKIGQLFMAGIPGLSVDPFTEILIKEYGLGGVILFSRNIETPLQVASLCLDLQRMSIKYTGKPLFLAVDQEGGRVSRLKDPFTAFPGNTAIGKDPRPIEKARDFASVTAREMKMVGLNMDLAPVIDVIDGAPEKHLEGRTFGTDPGMVASLGREVIRGLQENGVMAVAKHFPGLGRATIDPHVNLPVIGTDAEEMEKIHFPPFRAAIEAGVSAVMTSHAVYPAMDPAKPATLSEKILTGLLRKTFGFEGLIITDDLEMGAIEKKWGVADGAAFSFGAGADILLVCEDQQKVVKGIKAIHNKLLREDIPSERILQSEERIMKAKSRFLSSLKRVSLKEVREYFGA